ncbi:MAG: hypothetical protein ACOX3P_07015 [Saccharofermentanales bacterium]|jgi:hypothetical protein|nr:hypothetical protein [Bacillota bacterium]NLB09027.1 hypothetical protein [Clostridiales bacterium]
MAFSLETSIIMSLALSLFLQSSSLCVPEAVKVRNSAAATVISVKQEVNPAFIYRLETQTTQQGTISVLKCSPQKMVESLSLYRDLKFLMTQRSEHP